MWTHSSSAMRLHRSTGCGSPHRETISHIAAAPPRLRGRRRGGEVRSGKVWYLRHAAPPRLRAKGEAREAAIAGSALKPAVPCRNAAPTKRGGLVAGDAGSKGEAGVQRREKGQLWTTCLSHASSGAATDQPRPRRRTGFGVVGGSVRSARPHGRRRRSHSTRGRERHFWRVASDQSAASGTRDEHVRRRGSTSPGNSVLHSRQRGHGGPPFCGVTERGHGFPLRKTRSVNDCDSVRFGVVLRWVIVSAYEK